MGPVPAPIPIDFHRLSRGSRAMLMICHALMLGKAPPPIEVKELAASTDAITAADKPLRDMFRNTVSVLQAQQTLLAVLNTQSSKVPLFKRLELITSCLYAAYAMSTLVEAWGSAAAKVLNGRRDQETARQVAAEIDSIVKRYRDEQHKPPETPEK